MVNLRSHLPRRRTPWAIVAACALFVALAVSCGKSSHPTAPTPDPGPGPDPTPGSAAGDSARWAVMEAASDLYFSLKGSPNRNASTVAYLTAQDNVAFAGVSDSLGNVWACFDNDRVLLLLDNREFVGSAAEARLKAARDEAVLQALPPLGTEMPVSNQARLMNSLEARWHSSVAPIKTMLETSGYAVSTPQSGLPQLLNVHGDGIFYWASHAGEGGNLAQQSVFGVWTQTACDSSLDRFEPYKSYWANGEICWAVTEVQQPDGSLKPEFHYGITPKWVRKYMDFSNNSLVFLDGCTTGKQELRDAFFARNAGVYLGWNLPTSGASWVVAETFFDLMCGADWMNPQDPKQRPFLFDWVRDWMVSNGKNVDPNGPAHLYMNRNPVSPVFGLLRPTIFRIYTHDTASDPQDYIEIEGDFGLDPGAANRSVTVGGQPLGGVVWGEHLITANLPLTGAGSFGDVTVTSRGHLSNVAHLTKWVLPMTYTRYGPGSLQQQIDLSLILRGDGDRYRNIPYADPTGFAHAISASKASSGSFLMSGIYQPDPDSFIRWSGSGGIVAATIPGQVSQLGFLRAAGNINPGSRTISTFIPQTQVSYLITTQSGSSAGTAALVPFGILSLSYDANFVIKADSLGPLPTTDGTAKLKWGPASPDAAFNDGGR